MNSEMILTFVILIVTIVIFVWDKLRVDIVALLALLALALTGILEPKQALAGFSNTTVIMIAVLFVVGGGLFKTGVADWLGSQLLRLAGKSETRLIVMLMLGTALLSGFLSNTGTVAVLLPAVVAAAWRIGSVPSKLLVPLAFAASIGGMMTLIGTPPNIVISAALEEGGYRPFGFFEYTPDWLAPAAYWHWVHALCGASLVAQPGNARRLARRSYVFAGRVGQRVPFRRKLVSIASAARLQNCESNAGRCLYGA